MRYILSDFVYRVCGTRGAWGTLAVNSLGCFLFGLVWMMWDRGRLHLETRIIVLGGFMGAFTTFSTFAFETGQYLDDGQWLLAGLNLLAENMLGLIFLFLGFGVGRWL